MHAKSDKIDFSLRTIKPSTGTAAEYRRLTFVPAIKVDSQAIDPGVDFILLNDKVDALYQLLCSVYFFTNGMVGAG